jgi:ATP-dependent Clp protease ATP-binding subunit ClpA
VESLVRDELKKFFRPEFLNRLDETVVFHKLSKDNMHAILELQITALSARLREQGLNLEVSQEARDWLVENSFDTVFGARPLKRALETHVENQIAEALIEARLEPHSGDGGPWPLFAAGGSEEGAPLAMRRLVVSYRAEDSAGQKQGLFVQLLPL